MVFGDDPEDRVAIVQMNTELRQAQVELLSAQVATDRLRLRFAIEDLARHGQPEVLRKAITSSTALYDYYSAVGEQCTCARTASQKGSLRFDEERIGEAIRQVSNYVRQQRELYFPLGQPITRQQRARMEQFFPPRLLAGVRTVELAGRRLPKPSFYARA